MALTRQQRLVLRQESGIVLPWARQDKPTAATGRDDPEQLHRSGHLCALAHLDQAQAVAAASAAGKEGKARQGRLELQFAAGSAHSKLERLGKMVVSRRHAQRGVRTPRRKNRRLRSTTSQPSTA